MGVAWGARGEVFVVAIGSSCCGDTSEADLKIRLALGMKKAATGTALLDVIRVTSETLRPLLVISRF